MSKHLIRLGIALGLTAALGLPTLAAQHSTDWDQPYALACADFGGEDLAGIYITAVPAGSQGSFRCGDRILAPGDVLAADALDRITLESAAQTDQDLTLTYCPIENNQLGQPAVLTVAVSDGKTEPPTAQDGELETYKNVPNNGALTVTGGAEGTMTYTVTQEPKRGTVTIANDGTYLYTPNKNKVGKDRFCYTVTDSVGNTSEEAQVEIQIRKPDAAAYTDLEGDIGQFEAMWLQARGLYAGQELAGQRCFEPEAPLSRGEFLVMVMDLAGIEPDTELAASGFVDEVQAPAWMQPYLAAALRTGIVSGIESEAGLVFRPQDPVTCAQAAVILQNILALPSPETTPVFAAELVIPTWAASSIQALQQADLPLAATNYTHPLTHRQAAELLYAADGLLDQ